MIHHKTDANFRLKEWPRSSNHAMYYNDRYARSEFAPVIDFISDILYKSKIALIRHSVFTLANVVFPKSNYSYGFMPPPKKTLYGLSDIVLTFAFTKRQPDVDITPKFKIRLDFNSVLWGNSIQYPTDYLTIFLPYSIAKHMNLRSSSRDVEFLYYTLGPWSKNFIRNHDFYRDNKFSTYKGKPVSARSIMNKAIPDIVEQVTYDHWQYSHELWKRLPSIISPHYVTSEFSEYYCETLLKYYDKLQVASVKDIENKVFQYVESEYIDFLTLLAGSSYGQDAPASGFLHLLNKSTSNNFTNLHTAATYFVENKYDVSPLQDSSVLIKMLKGENVRLQHYY